jgi:hypothetical protein
MGEDASFVPRKNFHEEPSGIRSAARTEVAGTSNRAARSQLNLDLVCMVTNGRGLRIGN